MSKTIKKIIRNRLALFGLIIVITLFAVAVFAPFISPYNYKNIDVQNILMPPSSTHFFGTDDLGRDVYSRMIWGARISLAVGFVSVGISTLIGITLGCFCWILRQIYGYDYYAFCRHHALYTRFLSYFSCNCFSGTKHF